LLLKPSHVMKPMSLFRYSVLTTVLVLLHIVSNGQLKHNYHPRQLHSELSRDLIDGLVVQFNEENKNMPRDRAVRQVNFDRRMFFMDKVFQGGFIKDDSLENYVTNVLTRLVDNNSMQPFTRRVLVLSSPHVNAVCYGQGIYAVTVSLLSRIENENQLAFILAHELAHDEFGDVRNRIVQEANLELEDRAREQTFKVMSGRIDTKEIENFRKLIYAHCAHSRQNEIRADSMAVVFMRNAKYDEHEAFSALTILQSSQSPKREIGPALFLPFHSVNHPFQDYWLNDRLTVYSKKYMSTFLYSADSIESHPSIVVRKKILSTYLVDQRTPKAETQPLMFANAIAEIAAFETVESAYKNKEYDLAIYYALQLYNRYPQNAYIVSRISKMLSDLYEAKNSGKFGKYVAKYTPNHGEELKLINSLLYNLSQKELGEITFNFLNSNSNFSANEQGHYYLLWKISSLTKRNDFVAKLSDGYRAKFGAGINSYEYH